MSRASGPTRTQRTADEEGLAGLKGKGRMPKKNAPPVVLKKKTTKREPGSG